MTQYVVDLESIVLDVKDDFEAGEIVRRMIRNGDICIDRILKL